MKFRSLLLAGLLGSAAGANAQTWVSDSVTMGPGYATDVWYSLENGTIDTANNKNWTLAFQSYNPIMFGGVAVWANHAQVGAEVYVLQATASAGDFTDLTWADTAGKVRLYNGAHSWDEGAFNMNSTGGLDYGWGDYNIGSHHVQGNELFLIKTGTDFFKLWIQDYAPDGDVSNGDTTRWTFRIARMEDGSEDTTVNIYRADYATRNFVYWDAPNRVLRDREPATMSWDILFTRYTDSLDLGTGIGPNTTTGVLLNHDVKVSEVVDISPDTVMYANHPVNDNMLNAIGWDWKTFAGVYTTDTNRTYFIQDRDGNAVWQIVFTGFTSGTPSNKTKFIKRKMAMTGVSAVNSSVQRFLVSPVPASNNINLVLEAANGAGHGQVSITDMSGRVVYQAGIQVAAGMNAYGIQTGNLPAGNYILTARGEGFAVSQQVVIAR